MPVNLYPSSLPILVGHSTCSIQRHRKQTYNGKDLDLQSCAENGDLLTDLFSESVFAHAHLSSAGHEGLPESSLHFRRWQTLSVGA